MFSKILLIVTFSGIIFIAGCSGSGNTDEDSENYKSGKKENAKINTDKSSETLWINISAIAKAEQQNDMYQRLKDSTYLYWLNNELIILENSTKCNIFALNVLFKAGCKCPEQNTLTYDLMDTSKFNDIFPVIKINKNDTLDLDLIQKGDLIIWNGHVIISESIMNINDKYYAKAWWSGTKQENNGVNIINDVVHGNYPLDSDSGEFIVRRPLLNK